MSDKVQYWLDLANDDLGAAKAMLKSGYRLHAGYMCHLTIEKALKAAIAHVTNEIPPKIHHLVKLAEKAQITTMTNQQREILIELNPLNIEGRYPDYKHEIAQKLTNEKCTQLIQETEGLLCWIKKQLSAQPPNTPTK